MIKTTTPANTFERFASVVRTAAGKLGQLEEEFVKLGDGIINPPQPTQAQQTRNAIIRQQHMIEMLLEKEREEMFRRQYAIEEQIQQRNQRAAQQQQQEEDDNQAAEESRQRCLQVIQQHLVEFLEHQPQASYIEWLGALHPENATTGGDIDSRFLIPGNPWSEAYAQATAERRPVSGPMSLARVISA
mgnify:CR=1 FL=1